MQRSKPADSASPTPKPVKPGLTRAEQRALRRSAPLTATQFEELRVPAEQGVSPLRRI